MSSDLFDYILITHNLGPELYIPEPRLKPFLNPNMWLSRYYEINFIYVLIMKLCIYNDRLYVVYCD